MDWAKVEKYLVAAKDFLARAASNPVSLCVGLVIGFFLGAMIV